MFGFVCVFGFVCGCSGCSIRVGGLVLSAIKEDGISSVSEATHRSQLTGHQPPAHSAALSAAGRETRAWCSGTT